MLNSFDRHPFLYGNEDRFIQQKEMESMKSTNKNTGAKHWKCRNGKNVTKEIPMISSEKRKKNLFHIDILYLNIIRSMDFEYL